MGSQGVPLQGNGYDCGVCACLTMEMLTKSPMEKLVYPVMGDGVTISREYLNEARQRISIELMLGEIIVE